MRKTLERWERNRGCWSTDQQRYLSSWWCAWRCLLYVWKDFDAITSESLMGVDFLFNFPCLVQL